MAVARGLRIGDERAAAATARGAKVAALAERGKRLAQLDRAIPIIAHSSRSAGSRIPGANSPSLIAVPRRSTVSSNAV